MATQIERNAQMVADLAISDWRMAYIIACSVEKGAANGRPSKTSAADEVSGKVSMAEFARLVKKAAGGRPVYGMGQKGISHYLIRWDSVAEKGLVWDRSTLKPEDANDDVEFPDWEFRTETTTGKADDSNRSVIKANPHLVAEAMEDPKIAAAVAEAASSTAILNMDAVAAEQIEVRRDPAISDEARDRAKTRTKIENERHKDAVLGGASQIILKVAEINKALDEIERLAAGRITKADRATLVADFASVELRVPQVAHIIAGGSGDWDSALVALSEEK